MTLLMGLFEGDRTSRPRPSKHSSTASNTCIFKCGMHTADDASGEGVVEAEGISNCENVLSYFQRVAHSYRDRNERFTLRIDS